MPLCFLSLPLRRHSGSNFSSGGLCLTPVDAEKDKMRIYMISISSSFWPNAHFCVVSCILLSVPLRNRPAHGERPLFWKLSVNLFLIQIEICLCCTCEHLTPTDFLCGPQILHRASMLLPSPSSCPWLFLPFQSVYHGFASCQALWMASGTLWSDGWESHEVCLQLAHELLRMILRIRFDMSERIVPWLKITLSP